MSAVTPDIGRPSRRGLISPSEGQVGFVEGEPGNDFSHLRGSFYALAWVDAAAEMLSLETLMGARGRHMYLNQIHNPDASHNSDVNLEPRVTESQSDRARAIVIEVASIRAQGVEPVPEFFTIAERYVSGELSIGQFTAAIDGLRRRHAPAPLEPARPGRMTSVH